MSKDLPKTITGNVKTASKYGPVEPGKVFVVGEDIDEKGAARWIKNGIASPGGLKKKPEPEPEPQEPEELKTPTAENTNNYIRRYLDQEGIAYTSNMNKDELLDLL